MGQRVRRSHDDDEGTAGDPTPYPDHPESEQPGSSPERSLTPVLWLSLAAMVAMPLLAHDDAGRVATTLLVGGTAVVALRRSEATRALRLTGAVVVGVLTVVAVMSRFTTTPYDWFDTVGVAIRAVLLLVTPIVVVLRLAQRPKVTLDTVVGAIAAYIQMGLFFATMYQLDSLIGSTPFFTETATPTLMDFVFFSFVTLTTLGYGDLVPATDFGRSLAILEAVFGQLFLVTVVALAVGNIGSTLKRQRS